MFYFYKVAKAAEQAVPKINNYNIRSLLLELFPIVRKDWQKTLWALNTNALQKELASLTPIVEKMMDSQMMDVSNKDPLSWRVSGKKLPHLKYFEYDNDTNLVQGLKKLRSAAINYSNSCLSAMNTKDQFLTNSHFVSDLSRNLDELKYISALCEQLLPICAELRNEKFIPANSKVIEIIDSIQDKLISGQQTVNQAMAIVQKYSGNMLPQKTV
jgi:hypothetical protein